MLERPTLQNRWIIVGASAFALIAGGSPMLVFTFGVLLKPITEDTGWTRAEVSGALSLMLCATALMSPVIGVLVDRFGVRRPLIASILATACVFALISATPNLWLFWAGFLLLGTVSQGLQPIIYSKVVVAWFDDWRGIALGIVNAGQGIGAMLLPPITGILLAGFGWRGAYLGLALLLLIVTLPGAIAIIRENPARLTDRRGPVASDAGISLRALTRSRPFWLIVSSAFVLSLAINGTVPHMVALLTDRGYSTGAAVGAMSVLGLAGMAGRLGTGFLVDMFFAPFVAWVVFTLAACGMAIIWLDLPSVPPLAGIILMGAGIGAEIDLMSYLTSRYFAGRVFASIYGLVFFALIAGQALGAYIMGETFHVMKTYDPALGLFALAVLATGFLSLLFGPYAYPPEREHRLPAGRPA